MEKKKKLHTLNIVLIKPDFGAVEDIVDPSECNPPVSVPISGLGNATLYIKRSPPQSPRWANLFSGLVPGQQFAVPHVSAVLVAKHADRFFAICFGQGGRFLLRKGVCEERFGLLCALNAVDAKSFRCVDVQSLDAIQSHSRIQAGEASSPDQFGLDVEQDMLKAVVGKPKDQALGSRMAGADALSVGVRLSLDDLPFLFGQYKKQFEAELSAEDHEWVNNICLVKTAALMADLEAELVNRLNSNNISDIWMSIPEIIDWTTVTGFMFAGERGEVHSDITLVGFLKSIKGAVITAELLRTREVHCADADHKRVYRSWPVMQCLYAEIDKDDQKYILNGGQWFAVDLNFVKRTNADFAKMPYAKFSLPAYAHRGEGDYNEAVAKVAPTKYALLDKKVVQHGGGHGKVEICDLLSSDRHLIHVKLYGKSSVLSQLFSQGFVSGQLLQVDKEFRIKAKGKIEAPFDALLPADKNPTEIGFTIVFAIISAAPGGELHLPFFSRVNLNNVTRVLTGFGYKVELLKVSVDETFAKTTRLPPARGGKKQKAKA